MDIKSFLSANGIVIAEFQPVAYRLAGMNQIQVMTKDVSTVTRWLGLLHIEQVLSHDRKLVGFSIVHASTFTTKLVPYILLQALWRDIRSQKQHGKSIKYVIIAYAKTFLLNLSFPKTWIVADCVNAKARV